MKLIVSHHKNHVTGEEYSNYRQVDRQPLAYERIEEVELGMLPGGVISEQDMLTKSKDGGFVRHINYGQ